MKLRQNLFIFSAEFSVFLILLVFFMGCSSEKSGKTTVREKPTVVSVKASSNMFPGDERYNPAYLMEPMRAIWHAQSPPKFPEWIEVTFSHPAMITHLGLMAQENSPKGDEHTRGPRDFILQGSNNKSEWTDLLKVKDNIFSKGGELKKWDFNNKKNYNSYRILITSAGTPNLLTLRGIILE